jgi:3-oxoacyl-[acyl-carrier protein] reductase
MGALEGRVALVTGASRGIGAAVSRTLAGEGVRLGLASRSGDDLGIEGAVASPCDVRDPAAIEALANETAERFGGIDIVVGNAGVGSYGPFLDLPADQLEEILDVNVKGLFYTLRAALPHLLKSDAADVVTVASEAGRRGTARRSSHRSGSRRRSTTSCGRRVFDARTCARAAWPPTSRWGAVEPRTCPSSPA